jgi:sugar-specific transcriptional regulator TrmB
MLISEEYVQVLADLGLTHNEAKVYMILLCLQGATASMIHRESNVARQDVYRVLAELQEKELIEKVIAKPNRFKPIPPKNVIQILLQKRKERNSQLRKKTKKMFRNFREACAENLTPVDEGFRFVLLSKSETNPAGHIDKPGKAVDNAQKSVMGIITLPLFMKVKQMDEKVWKKAVNRGVIFRFMIGRRSGGKFELSLDPLLKDSYFFQIRWTYSAVPAAVLLVDDRQVFCRTGVKIDNPVLWSSAPSFAAMIKDYLETKWKSLESSGQIIKEK